MKKETFTLRLIDKVTLRLIEVEDELAILKEFLHNLHIAYFTGNSEKVKEGLNLISLWSYGHRAGNGTLSEEELEQILKQSLENFRNY